MSDRINETDDVENGLTDSENQHNTAFDNFDARKNKTFSNQLKSGYKQSVRYNINLRDTSSLAWLIKLEANGYRALLLYIGYN